MWGRVGGTPEILNYFCLCLGLKFEAVVLYILHKMF